ncbi:hypothetical protein EZS27_026458 [termite gut metagenome]|uniref:HTH HARE-type domain-containing protein n=1 Tax=termite gut metagenome TaxID=433724 RepID=A0A5J4QQS5_9ZZZZ
MSSAFLKIAEQVLDEIGHPMSTRDMYNYASNSGLIKSRGITPENTLRARLSEDLRIKENASVFIRTGANKFALRKWTSIKENIIEYVAPRFEKNHSNEYVVCINQQQLDKVGRFFGFKKHYKKYLNILSDRKNLTIISRDEANKKHELKQLTAYVLLKGSKGDYLSYQRGNYSNKNQLLKNVLCIGFGGHVNCNDVDDLFGIGNGGIWNAAYREVAEEIKNLRLYDFKPIGVINDDSSYLGLTHFAFVLEASLPKNFAIEKYNTELSINKLRFLSKQDLCDNYHKLEFWSQILAKQLNKKVDNFVKIIDRKKAIGTPVAIVGGIGTGKSEVSRILSQNTGYQYISTREMLAELTNQNDFEQGDRANFQSKSYSFITSMNGTAQLANKIFEKISILGYNVIIDGIRQIDTFEKLKKLCPNITLIYIDTSRDKAYAFFKERSNRDASIHEFREAVSHEVEKEVPLFKYRADVYIYNGEDVEILTNKLIGWLNERKISN